MLRGERYLRSEGDEGGQLSPSSASGPSPTKDIELERVGEERCRRREEQHTYFSGTRATYYELDMILSMYL
jgi:hypothetical protein